MARPTISRHLLRDKLCNRLDPNTRAEAQLAKFLKQAAKTRGVTRGELISSVMMNLARKKGYSGKNGQSLASFLNDMAMQTSPRTTRSALIEETMTRWAKRNGYKPKE